MVSLCCTAPSEYKVEITFCKQMTRMNQNTVYVGFCCSGSETLSDILIKYQEFLLALRVSSYLICKEKECHCGFLSSDYRRIQSEFSLCKVPSSAQDIHQLNGLLRNAFTLMAMLDYPYSTQFIGSLPANPVKVKSLRLKSETIKGYLTRNATFPII